MVAGSTNISGKGAQTFDNASKQYKKVFMLSDVSNY